MKEIDHLKQIDVQQHRKHIRTRIVNMFIALFCTIGLIGISGQSITEINGISGLLFLLCFCNLVYYGKRSMNYEPKDRTLGIWTSVIISVCLTAGFLLRDADSSGQIDGFGLALIGKAIVYGIVVFLFLTVLLQNLLFYLKAQHTIMALDTASDTDRMKKWIAHPWKLWMILTGIMVICWLPYFLTFFPGIFGSDPLESLRQVLGLEPWTNHHPILYTGYMKLFVVLFQRTIGINGALAVMTFCQMCIFAGILSYMLVWLIRRKAPAMIVWFGLIFTAWNPVIGVFSVYATKDVLFSGMAVLFVLHIYDVIRSPEETLGHRKYLIEMCVIIFLVLFLRNNGVFIIVGTLLLALVVCRQYWKKIGLGLLGVCLCMMIQKQVVFPLLGVEEGSFAESLSIPLQQIGQSMADGAALSSEQEQYLSELLPIDKWEEVYQAGYTDTIKFDEAFDDAYLNAHKGEFMKVWAGMLPHNLWSYVKGYLLQTVGYWDMQQTESLSAYGVVENELGVIQQDCIKNLTGKSLQPVMEQMILVCRKLPVLCYLTNMAIMVWILGFAIVNSLIYKRKEILVLMPLLLVWGTIMIAAPAAVKFRYLFANYLVWPFMLYLIYVLLIQTDTENIMNRDK